MRRSTIKAGAAACLLALSALWTLSAALGAPGADANVSIVDFAFTPSAITVEVGSSVTWLNNGFFTHTATSNIGWWNSGELGTGGSFSFTLTSPGVYLYHCAFHPEMTGAIIALTSMYLPLTTR